MSLLVLHMILVYYGNNGVSSLATKESTSLFVIRLIAWKCTHSILIQCHKGCLGHNLQKDLQPASKRVDLDIFYKDNSEPYVMRAAMCVLTTICMVKSLATSVTITKQCYWIGCQVLSVSAWSICVRNIMCHTYQHNQLSQITKLSYWTKYVCVLRQATVSTVVSHICFL